MTPAASHFWISRRILLVRNPVLWDPLKPPMVEAGEVVAGIHVEHPVHALSIDPERERVERIMRAAPGRNP